MRQPDWSIDSGYRWWICALLFFVTALSYIDRQTIAIVAPELVKEFNLRNDQLARILSTFLIAYTFVQLAAGGFFDWIGSRIGFSVSITVWSLANLCTAFVTQVWGFSFLRFMLGAGESGNFPGGVKVISEWFRPGERALAGGLFTSGASIGAVVAGPLVSTITHYWGWRAAFLVTGSLGFIWLPAWLLSYYTPRQQSWLSDAERESAASPQSQETGTLVRWLTLLRFAQVWALAIALFLEAPLSWLALFWLPKYMVDIRGLSLLHAGWLHTLPFIALDIGYVGGGWVSGKLVTRGWTIARAKIQVMTVAALLMACAIPAALAKELLLFTAFICLATLGHGIWFSNLLTIPSDIAPPRLVASVYGIAATGGGFGGLWFTEFTGFITERFRTFTPVFVVAGLLPLAGTIVLVLLGGTKKLPDDPRLGTAVHARPATT
jgi:ACS family hexuronate transporter-like MFS transporter